MKSGHVNGAGAARSSAMRDVVGRRGFPDREHLHISAGTSRDRALAVDNRSGSA
jgi:hypothetical protein